MKMAAAQAIADLVKKEDLSPEYIIPNALDNKVPIAVAQAVAREAINSGVAKELVDPEFVAENIRQFLIGGRIMKTKFFCV
jgi:malate dehydrogenase (oxaloacetate-decarboxylating)